VNAADYGFPQRRRRVFLIARHVGDEPEPSWAGPTACLYSDGVFARGLRVEAPPDAFLDAPDVKLDGDLAELTRTFGIGQVTTQFRDAGVMWKRQVWTRPVSPLHDGERRVLGDVLQATSEVPHEYFIPEEQVSRWEYLKGAKDVPRVAKNGHRYLYSEGGISFPDPLDKPSRTILTGEGGVTPSRFKHVIQTEDERLRRLTPIELERLNGFPDDWTNTGMSDARRAFTMGNALVVGLVARAASHLGRR
jgi:DNA (cytosine-5)-methyltransferase 1